MSKISIEGNALGSGTFTIASPNSNSNRTLNLPDASGTMVVTGGAQTIEFAAGTVSAPSITTTGDTNTGIFFPAADTIGFTEGGVEAMRIDSSGNVLVNTTTAKNNAPGVSVKTSQQGFIIFNGVGSSYNELGVWDGASDDTKAVIKVESGLAKFGSRTDSPLVFQTNDTERARISGSKFLIGTTSDTSGATLVVGGSVSAVGHVGSRNALFMRNTNSSGNQSNSITFGSAASDAPNCFIQNDNAADGTQVNQLNIRAGNSGGVFLASGGTTWSSVSDERLKTNFVPFVDALEKVISLRAGTGRYKTDEENVSRSFLLAQDVEKILPEAITVDSKDQTLGLRYTDIIPLLVAATKELKAELDEAKARIATLEAGA
jgi:hypothetical protein